MSREEAIEIFKRLKENAPNEMHLETVGTAQELFDMAIQALSQEPIKYWIDHNGHVIPIQQPSVTQKSGKWRPVYQGDEIINYRCSECEFGNTFCKSTYRMNYCPNCGSAMKGE